jgi:hypothetical protein
MGMLTKGLWDMLYFLGGSDTRSFPGNSQREHPKSFKFYNSCPDPHTPFLSLCLWVIFLQVEFLVKNRFKALKRTIYLSYFSYPAIYKSVSLSVSLIPLPELRAICGRKKVKNLFFSFFWCWGSNSAPETCTCQASALSLSYTPSPWVFLRWGLST